MFRNKLLILVMTFLTLTSSRAFSQVYEPGNVVIDAYYGWPNLFTSVVKAAYDAAAYDVKVGSIGPTGGKVEYIISERIGIGIHSNYSTTSVKGTYTTYIGNYDPSTGDYETRTYDYKASVNRFRVMPMFSVHIGSSDKVDPYVSFGGGYSSFKIKVDTDDPSYNEESVDIKQAAPVAVRGEFGVRYFFTNNIGANAFFGLGGGALLGAGISAKF